jgi:hypothetical protein
MQKKSFMIGVGLFFLSATIWPVLAATDASAQVELAVPSAAAVETSLATDSSRVKKSDYTLPYPGILSNHPLYFVKKFRDQVIEFLIVDLLRKADFYLLQSDKYLASSVLLDQQGKTPLAQIMLDQSSQRMADSVKQLSRSKEGGQAVSAGTIDRIKQAIEKHLEVIDEMTAKKTVTTETARNMLLEAEKELVKLKS